MSLKDSIRAKVKSWNGEGVIMILSLVLAVLIWVLTNLSKDYSGTISVPVVAQCNIDGHGMESTNTVVVSARCRTDGSPSTGPISAIRRPIPIALSVAPSTPT